MSSVGLNLMLTPLPYPTYLECNNIITRLSNNAVGAYAPSSVISSALFTDVFRALELNELLGLFFSIF